MKELDELKKSFPADVDYKVPFESVLWLRFPWRKWLNTLLIALVPGCPCCISVSAELAGNTYSRSCHPGIHSGTFVFFIPLGFTINTLTMFGFVLAIGIVVDDAIIVVEAVQHYIDERKCR